MANEKILVVDDDRNIVKLITLRLRINGYRVITAFDGNEALEKAEKEKPDLILLNIMIPRLNGITTTLKLKSKRRTKSIPIIIISGVKDRDEQILAKHAGVADYIAKPLQSKELLAKIEKALRN